MRLHTELTHTMKCGLVRARDTAVRIPSAVVDGLDLTSLVKESVLLALLVGTMVLLTERIPY